MKFQACYDEAAKQGNLGALTTNANAARQRAKRTRHKTKINPWSLRAIYKLRQTPKIVSTAPCS